MDDVLTPRLDAEDRPRGELGRPLGLVMYGDFQCPFCLGAQSALRRVDERHFGAYDASALVEEFEGRGPRSEAMER